MVPAVPVVPAFTRLVRHEVLSFEPDVSFYYVVVCYLRHGITLRPDKAPPPPSAQALLADPDGTVNAAS